MTWHLTGSFLVFSMLVGLVYAQAGGGGVGGTANGNSVMIAMLQSR